MEERVSFLQFENLIMENTLWWFTVNLKKMALLLLPF